jgi:hypothetical protein
MLCRLNVVVIAALILIFVGVHAGHAIDLAVAHKTADTLHYLHLDWLNK